MGADPARRYWEEHFQDSSSAGEVVFNWYADVRCRHFGPPPEGPALEIGPGGGYFAARRKVGYVADISLSSLGQVRKRHHCSALAADAARLPFSDESFAAVYTCDVAHHLKAYDVLPAAADEIRRVLKPGGLWFISDRRPWIGNDLLLALNALGRGVYQLFGKAARRGMSLSGGDKEPAMRGRDFAVIKQDMAEVSRTRWRNMFVFFGFAGMLFLGLPLGDQRRLRLARRCVKLFELSERLAPGWMKSDVCLVLRKGHVP